MSFAPTYPNCPVNDVPNDMLAVSFVGTIWLWLRFWFSEVMGQGVDYGAEAAPQPMAVNRAKRHLNKHFSKSNLPPARNLAPFRRFGRGDISPAQFLERRCRLSCDGRIDVYRMVYWSHRRVCEAFMALFERGELRAPRVFGKRIFGRDKGRDLSL